MHCDEKVTDWKVRERKKLPHAWAFGSALAERCCAKRYRTCMAR